MITTIFGIPIQAFLGQLLLGLVNGSFYAILSLGLAVIFGLLNVINFAHGALYMLGAFLAWSLSGMLGSFTLAIMVGGIINIFVGSTAGMMAISVLSIGVFSAYMLYDLKRIVDGGETNYISATLALYLDIVNVFQSLLALLGIMGGERD